MQQMNKHRIDLGHSEGNTSRALVPFSGTTRANFYATGQNNAFLLLLRMPVFVVALAHCELRNVVLLLGRLARSVCLSALAPRGAPRLFAPPNDPQTIAASVLAPLDTAAFRNLFPLVYG